MIILADVPFIDALSYAQSLSKGKNIYFWSSGDSPLICKKDIFSDGNEDEICFINKIDNQEDFDYIKNLNSYFKVIIIFSINTESFKKYCSLNNIEYKLIQIPKYVNLRQAISNTKSIKEDVIKLIINDLNNSPLSQNVNRDFASSVIHKVSVIFSEINSSHLIHDIVLNSPKSIIDLNNSFCRGEHEFLNFCYYYFKNNKNDISIISLWISLCNKFLISNNDLNHKIYSDNLFVSKKVVEVVNNGLSSCIKKDDFLFYSCFTSLLFAIKSFDDLVFSINIMRSTISGKLNKKQSIYIVRNLYE